jgi:hypothetical protein
MPIVTDCAVQKHGFGLQQKSSMVAYQWRQRAKEFNPERPSLIKVCVSPFMVMSHGKPN